MVAELDYIAHVRRESARFAACLASAHRSLRVPSCPDWTAADLLWHLTEVQLFWGAIVRDRLDDPDAADAGKPDRPDDDDSLRMLFDHATTALVEALTSTPGRTEVWTWAHDHSVDFVRRRQAHEALIHRLDAELVIGDPTAIDPQLAADGVDEALAVMYGDVPVWATFIPDGTTGVVEAGDTHARWHIGLGRFAGTSPDTGNVYDMEIVTVVRPAEAAPKFTVRSTAADLDAWLWGRAPESRLEVDGDRAAFARLEEIVGRGIQ